MERKIGEIFEYNSEWYQCVKGDMCADCAFAKKHCNENPLFEAKGSCKYYRKDATSAIFKKLEKIGEPYKLGEVLIQQYQGIAPVVLPEDSECLNIFRVISSINVIEIEIKQTKEAMEEKNNGNTPLNVLTDKYVNGDICYDDFEKEVKALYSCKEEIKPTLKEFDLEAAKAGKPVCTRDGRKARIICFDKKCLDGQVLIVLVDCGKEECMYFYTTDGKCIDDFSSYDLMMPTEKKEGWVNVYKKQIHNTFESAEEGHKRITGYIKTIKVEWEE